MLSTLDPPRRVSLADSLPWGRAVWAASVLVFAVIAVAVVLQPVRWLLGFVADDAFYYLQTARHIAATGRSTFDGLNPTNGYHPGWMLLMTACAKLFPDRVMLLRACLTLEFAFHLVGAWLLGRVLRSTLGPDWAGLAAAGWLLNPFPLGLALNGVEAPLTVACVLLVALCWQTRIAPVIAEDPLPPRNLLWLGLSLACAIYARTDQTLLLPVVIGALLVALRRAGRPWPVALRASVIVLGTIAVCLLPWLLYSYHTVGTVQQDSGAMKMLWHRRISQAHGVRAVADDVYLFLAQTWLAFPLTSMVGGTGVIPPRAFLTCLTVLAVALCAGRRHPQAPAFGALSGVAAVCLGLSGAIYGLTLADFQRWHFAVPALILYAVVFGWVALAVQQRLSGPARPLAALLVVGLICLPLTRSLRPLLPNYPWQRAVYDSQPRFNALVPDGARLGCLNAGIPAFFSDRPIINLDGLVNHTAVAYWQRGEFDRYLRAQRIEYVADEPAAVGRASYFARRPIPGWVEDEVPLPGWRIPVRQLWHVDLSRIAP